MNITNVDPVRVIVHEVVRASQIAERSPVLSDDLVVLDDRSKALVGRRLIETVSSGSHCVDVTVADGSAGSPFCRATAMLDTEDDEFVTSSKYLAMLLSTVQTAGAIKSGSVIFIQGSCSADGRDCRFLAIIKADSDQALLKRISGEVITLTYVNDMVLGDSQRLIKIAFFIEEHGPEGESSGERQPEDFSVKVFDHLMQSSGSGEAATYFYSSFLKCKLSNNAARQTKRFYELAHSFIDDMPVSQAERVAYQSDLLSYFRQNRETIEPRTFAQDVLPHEGQDPFLRKCREEGLGQAFSKQLDLVKGRLRRQSLKFSSNVTLYAPADVFRDAVRITGISEDGWTELKIRGSIESMP
jgi:hypothetical protein